MALEGGPREIYRASNHAQDMSQYLLDRGREQLQGRKERAEACGFRARFSRLAVGCWSGDSGDAVMATGEAAAAGPNPWNGVGLPVLSDKSGGVRYPHAEPIVAMRSPVRESRASLTDRLAERHFPRGRIQRGAQ